MGEKLPMLRIRIRCRFAPWIRDTGWVKNQDPGSGLNNPDHISNSLETVFWVKTLKWKKWKNLDPGWKISYPGFGINIPDPYLSLNVTTSGGNNILVYSVL
jgi:hypothetical protein